MPCFDVHAIVKLKCYISIKIQIVMGTFKQKNKNKIKDN